MQTSQPDDGRGLVVQQTAAFVKALQGTPVFQRFSDALSRFETDSDVQRLLADFQRQAKALQRAQQQGTAKSDQVQAIRHAQTRVQAHPIVREFVEAQQALGLFLQETNAVISEILGMDFGQTAGPAGGAC